MFCQLIRDIIGHFPVPWDVLVCKLRYVLDGSNVPPLWPHILAGKWELHEPPYTKSFRLHLVSGQNPLGVVRISRQLPGSVRSRCSRLDDDAFWYLLVVQRSSLWEIAQI